MVSTLQPARWAPLFWMSYDTTACIHCACARRSSGRQSAGAHRTLSEIGRDRQKLSNVLDIRRPATNGKIPAENCPHTREFCRGNRPGTNFSDGKFCSVRRALTTLVCLICHSVDGPDYDNTNLKRDTINGSAANLELYWRYFEMGSKLPSWKCIHYWTNVRIFRK